MRKARGVSLMDSKKTKPAVRDSLVQATLARHLFLFLVVYTHRKKKNEIARGKKLYTKMKDSFSQLWILQAFECFAIIPHLEYCMQWLSVLSGRHCNELQEMCKRKTIYTDAGKI